MSLDFGSFGETAGFSEQLAVEVRDGVLAGSGAELIDAASAQFVAGGNSGSSVVQAGAVITLVDDTGTANGSYFTPVPTSPQFSSAFFTFTALSATSTLVFTDQTEGSGSYSDANLDNVRVTGAPEPASALLMVMGVGLRGVRRRSSR